MSIERTFDLIINASTSSPLVINANQNDSGEIWKFNLYQEDGTKVIPTAGQIVGLKSDGHAIVRAGTVNSSGQVVIKETAQMTAAPGANVYEIVFDSVHGTANFILYVEKSPVDDGADFSKSDISAIQQAIAMAIDSQTVAALQTGLQNETAIRAAADAALRKAIDDAAIVPAGSTVVVDASLSISGAAADAKVTGDAVTDLKSALNIVNPKTDIKWTLAQSVGGDGSIINNPYMANSHKIPCDPGDKIIRTGTNLDTNGKFLVYYVSEFNGDSFIKRTELTSSNKTVILGSTTNYVYISFGRYGSSGITIAQNDINSYFSIQFFRNSEAKAELNEKLKEYVHNGFVYTDNVNNIVENSFRFVPEGTANLPTSTGGYLVETILYGNNPAAALQNAYRYDNGARYYRRKVSNAWKDWLLKDVPSMPSGPLYYAFGDSLTYGAVWTPKDESPYYQIVQASIENQIPTRIANAIGAGSTFQNKGVGGAYFVGTGSNKIITAIKNQNLSNAKIITVAGGRNDSENPLGDKNSTVGDGTICGAIKEILEYLTTTYKQLQIVWIGVTPNTSNNATVFTRVFAGGWSLNSFDEKVSELCAEYGVPYVNWKMCTYMRHWADYSGAGNVFSHPNNENSYLQMGNYIAGKVSALYKG